jgi:hypothetical protein
MLNMKILILFLLATLSAQAQVFDGQAVNQTITNNAFVKRNIDDIALGRYTLQNTNPISGGTISNLQREVNSCSSYTGKPANSVYNALPGWTNNDVGLSTDTLKTRSDLITQKFNDTLGHKHTGVPGDAPQIDDSGISSSAAIARSKIAPGTANYVLLNDSSGYLSEKHHWWVQEGGTGLTSYTLGDILYGSSTNAISKLAGNTSTTTKFLTQTGDGVNSAAPIWMNLSFGSLGSGVVAISNGGTGQTSKKDAFDALSPAATKGDLIVHSGSHGELFPVCANGQVMVADSTQGLGWKCDTAGGGSSSDDTVLFVEEHPDADGTCGGLTAYPTLNTRQLNTTYNPHTWAVLASNKVTLTTGTYEISGQAPAFRVTHHAVTIYDFTNSVPLLQGTDEYADAGVFWNSHSNFIGIVTVTDPTKVIFIQHLTNATRATDGAGIFTLNAYATPHTCAYMKVRKLL